MGKVDPPHQPGNDPAVARRQPCPHPERDGVQEPDRQLHTQCRAAVPVRHGRRCRGRPRRHPTAGRDRAHGSAIRARRAGTAGLARGTERDGRGAPSDGLDRPGEDRLRDRARRGAPARQARHRGARHRDPRHDLPDPARGAPRHRPWKTRRARPRAARRRSRRSRPMAASAAPGEERALDPFVHSERRSRPVEDLLDHDGPRNESQTRIRGLPSAHARDKQPRTAGV